jgi:HAD superfamily hydrolase (TIGR01549 family)
LNNLDLLKYFSFVLRSNNCNGLSKPNKDIFLKAFKLSGLKNQNEYLHIGDSYDLNIKPASKLNFKTILIRHFGSNEIFAII